MLRLVLFGRTRGHRSDRSLQCSNAHGIRRVLPLVDGLNCLLEASCLYSMTHRTESLEVLGGVVSRNRDLGYVVNFETGLVKGAIIATPEGAYVTLDYVGSW